MQTEERRQNEGELEERIREVERENAGLGQIADLLRQLLQASKEDKEELSRLRKIQDDIKIRDETSESDLQTKQQQFAEKQSSFLNKIAELQKDIDLLKQGEKSKQDTATQQSQAHKRKINELTEQNISNRQEFEEKINQMSLDQHTAQERWITQYENLKTKYDSLLNQAGKHQEANKTMEIQILRGQVELRQTKSKYERERKTMEAQFQKEKQEQQKQLREEQKSRQRLNAMIKQLQATTAQQRNTIEGLTVQNSKKTQTHQQTLAQMQTLKDQCNEKIISETARLNTQFNGKMQSIIQENQKTMEQINVGFTQAIDKQIQTHLKEVDQLREQLRDIKKANQSNIQTSSYELARLKSTSESEKQQLTDMLTSIYKVVFGRSLQVVDNKQITQFVQKKFNDLTEKIQSLDQALQQNSKQCKTLQSQLDQVKKFLSKFSIKLNNPEILNALDQLDALKAQNFVFVQHDITESVAKITKRLALRLKEFKEEAESLQREKGELLGQQFDSDRKTIELQKRIELLESKLKKEEESAKELIAEHKEKKDKFIDEKQTLEKNIKSLNDSIDQLSNQIVSLTKQVDDLSRNISQQNKEIFSLSQQNTALKDHLTIQANKNERSAEQISSLQQQCEDLSKENIQLLESSDALSTQIRNIKAEMSNQEQRHEAQRRKQIDQINAFIEKQYDSRAQLDSFDAFLDFLRGNQASSEVIPFTVSHIFERAAKERQILITQATKFLNNKLSSSTLLYKYDQFNKNFSNYLPIRQNFHFVILARTMRLQIFGVLSTGFGRGSRALAFNLTQPKFFENNPNNVSSNYDSGNLLFGQGEIRFRNNSTLQTIINSRIFGARHFTFKKAEIVGKDQESDSVQLQALQIHRLNY